LLAGLPLWAASNSLFAQTPVLHWAFDELDGNIAQDSGSGEPASGILQATASRTNETPGFMSPGALDLSAPGLDSWVNGGDVAKVDTLTQFTMSTWILLKGLNADQGGSGNVRLLAKQAGGAFDGFSWNLNAPNEGTRGPDNFRMGMFIGGETGFSFAFSEDLGADDQWTFVAATYDGTTDLDNLIFYIGDETTSVDFLGDPLSLFSGPINSTAGIANVNVGMTEAAPGIDFSINGYQDDVRIYDRVLSLEEIEQVRLANLTSLVQGDFDGNGVLDAADIDLLSAGVRGGENPSAFDLNGDSLVNIDDLNVWVEQLRGTWFGDANLDGEFNSGDLVQVFQAGQFEDSMPLNSGWAAGDWNGDGDFDSSDFVRAFQGGGFEQGPRPAAAAVPEPNAALLLGLGSLGLFARSRTRTQRCS
jgi:hypothetical protein